MSGARASRLLIPTLKDDPADAEAISHKLLVRGGFVRQVASGLYSYLPLGWRVMRRIDRIIREEMDTIGQDMLMPVLNPAELWERTGRWDIPQLYKLEDSSGRPYALAMTHEECVTFHAAHEIRSYKELPQIWYHIQTKERDEPRPKSGILRTREFLMKDSYSLDRDEEGLDLSYRRHIEVYRRIYDRCGLRYWMVESDVGMMGGLGAHEFMAPSSAGEDEVALCSSCDYAANVELARSRPRPPEFPERLDAPREVETPGVTTIEGLAAFLGIDPAATAKAMVVVKDDEVVLGLVRGDHRLHELKMAKALGGEFRPATAEEIVKAFGAEPGSIGAVGATTRIIADEALRDGQFVGGANRTGYHLLGVEAGRDYRPEFADIREVQERDGCPNCDGTLHIERVIEIGNIFKLGTKYSVPLNATYLDESGREQPIVMGSYGIGLARIMAAAIEQGHDDKGMIWPASIAPFQVHVVVIGDEESEQFAIARRLDDELSQSGVSVLFDDRDASPGVKFADAELIGAPVRITVGKRTVSEGTVDIQARRGREQSSMDVQDAGQRARSILEEGA
ncbi:MAG TPA: proline--tRNA ligase [Gaiellales bacterium]|nr:proline--tRNA ligase [Gaiellales bacterium]